MKRTISDDNRTRLLLISDQVMLKAANQVMFQTIRGYLQDGFHVDLVVQRNSGHEKENLESIDEVLPEFVDQIDVHEFGTRFEFLFEMGRLLVRRLRSKRKATPSISFPASNTVIGFEATRGSILLSDLRFHATWSGAYKVAKAVAQRNRPDVICGFEVGGSVPAARLAKKLKVPIFTKYMGTIAAPFIDTKTDRQIAPYIAGLTVDADLYFMLNDGTHGREVLEKLGVPATKIRFRIDGVDKKPKVSNLATRQHFSKVVGHDLTKEDFLCLCLSNHNGSYKRLDRAVRATSIASRTNPLVKLILVGNGSNTAQLRALSASLGCEGNVIFSPKISHTQTNDLLSIVDLYMNTNDQSNLSHPVFEAMVAGKPVLSMNDGSLDGIIESDVTGVLVDPKNCEALLPEKMLLLAANPEIGRQIGQRAYDSAQAMFMTWDQKNRLEIREIRNII